MSTSEPWLDPTFFLHILESEEQFRGGHGNVSILNCVAKPGSKAGCNFLSSNARVRIEYTINNSRDTFIRSFFVKAPLPNEIINEKQLIQNELKMYDEVIPRIYEMTQLNMAPKRYVCSVSQCLVMEDLTETGYIMCDSTAKLDFKHTKAALITLAKFHAASVALKHEDPDTIKRNGVETVYTHDLSYSKRFKPRTLMRLYGLAKVLQSIKGCEKYGEILINAGEEFWDLIVELFKPNSKLNVLNHGDFWTNNIMFKYDSAGFISDVKFVDYQMRRYCSPALDLLYLFWTSTDDGARMRMYELLEMYRHTLNSCLTELGCPEHLSRHELKEEVSKRSPSILLICLYLPIIFPDPDNPIDINEVEASEETMKSFDFNLNPILSPFKNNLFRTALPEMCKELETMKIFQILIKNKK